MRFSDTKNLDQKLRPHGSVLLMVLVAITLISLTAGTYLVLMQNEHAATRYRGRREQARLLVESGVEYLKAFLEQSDTDIEQQGGLYDNSDAMQGILVIENTSPAYRGLFTILAPKLEDGYYSDLRYGMENESAKLNLNVLLEDDDEETDTARDRLLAVPGIDSEIADSILDWLDEDDDEREYGAERSHYQDLPVEYEPRNGQFTGLDELLMIKGVTAELLYGLDADRSYEIETHEEESTGALEELENNEGQLNRGLSAYLTVHSMERVTNPDGKAKIDVNGKNLKKLYRQLRKAVSEDAAKFIILYRQNGAVQSDSTGGAEGGAESESEGESATLSSTKLDYKIEAKTEITTLLDLINSTVSVKKIIKKNKKNKNKKKKNSKQQANSQTNNQPSQKPKQRSAKKSKQKSAQSSDQETEQIQLFDSPWQEDSENFQKDFLALLDHTQVTCNSPRGP